DHSARHGDAALLEDHTPFGLCQPAPHPEGLAGLQRELAALLDHRATPAHFLGLRGPSRACGVPLHVRLEESDYAHAPARPVPLPPPREVIRAYEPTNVVLIPIS